MRWYQLNCTDQWTFLATPAANHNHVLWLRAAHYLKQGSTFPARTFLSCSGQLPKTARKPSLARSKAASEAWRRLGLRSTCHSNSGHASINILLKLLVGIRSGFGSPCHVARDKNGRDSQCTGEIIEISSEYNGVVEDNACKTPSNNCMIHRYNTTYSSHKQQKQQRVTEQLHSLFLTIPVVPLSWQPNC